MMIQDVKWHFLCALLSRVSLLVFGVWLDSAFHLPYTDIDYHVYTDAARYVSQSGSPYERDTYRYSPLLSYLMLPNLLIPWAGKVIFVVCDLLSSLLLYHLTKPSHIYLYLLHNPVLAVLSTRGSSESLISLLLMLMLCLLRHGYHLFSGLVYGVVVHLRIYPAIYSLPLLLYLKNRNNSSLTEFNSKRLAFFFSASLSFLMLAAGFYDLYGWQFVNNSFLYHIWRKDVKHNFSLYFYPLYLSVAIKNFYVSILSAAIFIPQILLQVAISSRFYNKLPVCFFLQTLIFVVYNKVYTAQYFSWFFTFLPFIAMNLPHLYGGRLPKKLLVLVLCWCVSLMFWLASAYSLEFLGLNTFTIVWSASLVFHVVNVASAIYIVRNI